MAISSSRLSDIVPQQMHPPCFLERLNSEIPSVKERDSEMEVATSPLDMNSA